MDAGVWSAANLVSEWSDVQERLDLTLGVVREDESHGNAAKSVLNQCSEQGRTSASWSAQKRSRR